MAKPQKCRYIGKPCIEHECVQYVQLIGADPQSGAPIDNWVCIDIAMLKVTLENTLAVRRLDGELNAFRNESAAGAARLLATVAEVPRIPANNVLELPGGG